MTSLTSFSRPRPERHIADLFSLSNLLFGLVSIAWSLQGRYALALFCVALGAVCDGLDGAAARKWGGTRLGVLADDVFYRVYTKQFERDRFADVLLPANDGVFGPETPLGWPNRLLMVTYVGWSLTVALQAGRVAEREA